MIRRPDFWNKKVSLALVLLPLSLIWWLGSSLRHICARPYHAKLPVICIGNLSVGGTGKTPTAILVAQMLKQAGWHPALLTRGYGGTESGPCWIDITKHTAVDVGDEPLLLSRHIPVCVSKHRADGARFIEAEEDYDVIVMDDGLQNPSLYKDIAIGVFDGGVGIGNGWLLPAGPMREPFVSGIKKLDVILINGADQTNIRSFMPIETPVFTASIIPDESNVLTKASRYVAFAGIGRPERFFQTLENMGAEMIAQHAYPDHHPFTEAELIDLSRIAYDQNAVLITTEKDWYRLPRTWQNTVKHLPVSLKVASATETEFTDTIIDRLNYVIP